MDEIQAKERVKEIKGFYSHLMTYVVINTGLDWQGCWIYDL